MNDKNALRERTSHPIHHTPFISPTGTATTSPRVSAAPIAATKTTPFASLTASSKAAILALVALTLLLASALFSACPALADDVIHSGGDYTATAWDEATSPDYVRVAGQAVILHGDIPRDNVIHYGSLDNLGRATWAAGYVTPELWAKEAAEGRETEQLPDPVGWKDNTKVTIPGTASHKDYKGYFYNRSHLVADSLGGDPILENLVTGTRTQNVGSNDGKGGMAYTETAIRNYMTHNPQHTVYYAATPVYVGDELVPRSVYVDVQTQDGSIDEHVEVYNVAKGYYVDYATGAWGEGDPNSTRVVAGYDFVAPAPDAVNVENKPENAEDANVSADVEASNADSATNESAEANEKVETSQDSVLTAPKKPAGQDVAHTWMIRWGVLALVTFVLLAVIAIVRRTRKSRSGDERSGDDDEDSYEDDGE